TFILICLLCGVLATRAESFNDTTTAEDPIALDEEDDNVTGLFMGNLSLCQNIADNVFLPFVGDCNKYYLCRSGQAIQLQCEWPYQFNAPTQSCVNLGEAECMPICQAYAFSTFIYQRTCTKYVLCYYGRPVLRECQDGLQYNSRTERCDFPQNVDCVESECSIYFNAYHLRYVPSKVSCEKYFLCGNGVPREQTCAPGLYFSSNCSCCDIPSNSDCQIQEPPSERKILSRLSPHASAVICPATGVHFYAHETRQDSYHFCVDGHGLVLECSQGLWYDHNVKECRDPQNILH
ncbi:hypothetical protein KR009_003964, partial [Drosophila setifemur]